MHIRLALILVLVSMTTAVAHETGNSFPPKPTVVGPPNVPGPHRQGGDTIADAVVIPSLPFSDTGTTAGFVNDYDEVCPFTGSTAPDVVYRYTPAVTEAVAIDLCGSDYDTKLDVYDGDMNLFACNDDFYFGEPCGVYVSALENLLVQGGTTYFIVIDGYGGEYGGYALAIETFIPCVIECPAGSFTEGEPPLVDDYIDNWNGGCNSPGFPFEELGGDATGNLILCGVSGWYVVNGSNYRDTDSYHIYAGGNGLIAITAEAEHPTYVFELVPQDCAYGDVGEYVALDVCQAESMNITGYPPGHVVWLWVASAVFVAPSGFDNEYNYVLWFSGLESAVATEPTTWSTLKSLYQ
jgi:hypothetical protein